MKIIKYQEYKVEEHYWACWDWEDSPGSGYSFECDSKGDIFLENLAPAGLDSLELCLNSQNLIGPEIRLEVRSWTDPGIGLCHCGAEVKLDSDPSECLSCHRIYNMSGQELAPVQHWEEN
jgi:hypothetical protein